MTYLVWSTHVDGPDARHNVIELRRTDRKVAEEDAALIRDIFHRNAWVQDEGAPDQGAPKSLNRQGFSCPLK